MVCDYKERGVSTFHHDRGQMAHVFQQIILPHIDDRPSCVYFENLDRNKAEPEELGRAFFQLIKIAKSHKNGIFRRRLRDSDFPTLPRELSSTDKIYYSKPQLEKDKELMQMHTDFGYYSMLLSMHSVHPMVPMCQLKVCSRIASSLSRTWLPCYSSTMARSSFSPVVIFSPRLLAYG